GMDIHLTSANPVEVPIRARNQVVGVLDVQSADLQAFDESDVMVIETLADQLAVAIENARLHEKVQQELNERIQAQLALEEHSERLEEMVNARTKALRDAQEQLVRQEKLAVLGQLSGSLAHELRNPLSAISSAAYLLGMFLTNAGPEVKEALEILTQEVRASERVINGLLGFARTKRPSCRTMHINDLLSDLMAHITLPPGVELDSRLDTAVPAMSADPDQLSQVFGNLIQNGLQAMHRGGTLTISSFLDGTEQVAVQVHDTGVGIPAENLDKLFEPLFTTKAKGIGLGLSLVKNLVEGHGGRIEVTSEKDKGATFTVRLPLQEEPQKTN
ncbi:MAG: ATP-binding protein, partial [Anaerolineae bacterium]